MEIKCEGKFVCAENNKLVGPVLMSSETKNLTPQIPFASFAMHADWV